MPLPKRFVKGFSEVIILQILSEKQSMYGYELLREIEERSEQDFIFEEGTLYPLLYRLEARDYITSEKKVAPSGKERRYYSLTESGKKLLQSKTKELKVLMKGLKRLLPLNSELYVS